MILANFAVILGPKLYESYDSYNLRLGDSFNLKSFLDLLSRDDHLIGAFLGHAGPRKMVGYLCGFIQYIDDMA